MSRTGVASAVCLMQRPCKRGIGTALTNGNVEVLGGFAIRRGDTPTGKTLRELASSSPDGKFVAVPDGREDTYFSDFLSAKLKAEGESGLGRCLCHHPPRGRSGRR
jgi:hypothetical protein